MESTGETARLGEALGFLQEIWALDSALQVASKRMESRLGVTGPQRLALRVLGRMPAVTAGELAQVLRLHPSTLTGILRRLESRGLVQRVTDKKDRRRVRLSLTAEGEQVNQLRSGTVESAVRHALSRTSAEDIAAARRVLGELSVALGRIPAGEVAR